MVTHQTKSTTNTLALTNARGTKTKQPNKTKWVVASKTMTNRASISWHEDQGKQ